MDININPKEATILVVDDEKANVILLERTLAMGGYTQVISTQDPTEVSALYQQHQCDLILLDINIPKMDGYAVMEQLKQDTDDKIPPILVLTAQDMQNFRQRALDGGARDYVTKPFDIAELLSRIRNLLDVQMAHKYMLQQNDILEQRVKERTYAIYDTRLQVVRRLGLAAEYRDNETGMHIIRMSNIAALLAKSLGLDEQQCELLLNAAPMHDIGKIGIPDNILLKPGKFEPEEWKIMQTHAQIGADILEGDDSDLMLMAHDIALNHHEKWDGSGYPNGKKGEEISMVSRVASIADVFDALTSERPYKKAWPVDDAVALIKRESGTQFDPKVVDVFIEKLDQVLEIREKYSEPEE